MSLRDSTKLPAMRVALGALVIAVATVGWTFVRALRADPLPEPPRTSVASLDAITHARPRPAADIQAAVENDLFASDRSAPDVPYRMPGEGNDEEKRAEPMKPVVLGTAVATDGRNFATLQLGDGSPTLVHVGDKIGEWTVRAISRGKVVLLSTGGTRAELAAPKPGT
jgi:hypothetical protein